MAIEKPKLGQITQGTIYSAAAAENYFGFPTWGLCITARCDVAHETKTEVFNYVPVVRYEDWLLVDGFRTLFNRIKAEHVGVLKSSLSQAKLSSSVLETYSPSVVVNKFFPSTEKTDQKIKKIHECAAAIEEIQELRSKSSISAVQLKNICSTSSKTAEKLAKDLQLRATGVSAIVGKLSGSLVRWASGAFGKFLIAVIRVLSRLLGAATARSPVRQISG